MKPKERQQEEKIGEDQPCPITFLVITIDGKHMTCKKFFVNTLDISDMVARKCRNNLSGVDMESRPHVTPNKTTEAKLDEVKNHINSYQIIESHYCRIDIDPKTMFVCAYIMLRVSKKSELNMHCSTIMPISKIVLQGMGQKKS